MSTLYKIGPLLLDPETRVLTHEGVAVSLGARAVAVLSALVSRANEYLEKSAILDAAWPGLVVEEANLAVQISAIRRALARVPGGESWIETQARRGYRFVGPVAEIPGRSEPRPAVDRRHTNLPELLTSFVGRERELAEIKQRLPGIRLLTLTGTGGIGKTRLAQQLAVEVLAAYRDGAWFVDLAPLRDPALVPSALAQVLQVKESAGQTLVDALCNHLRAKEILLILDNCEHVLDRCARLAEVMLRESAQVTVIATSRESLHLAGEDTYPLGSLPLPDPKATVQTIAGFDAVRLFVERARQRRPHFDLNEPRARAVAEICMRLDGIPLALELAAARVAVLPVEQIVRLLDQRFRLLTSGNRDLPRHQTLRAMIDWSYELLDDAEKALFVRLSVFAGGWTIAAAEAICGGEPIAKDEVVYVLIRLIEQSLVVADEDGDRYRLLETAREYARGRLAESRDADVVRLRHRGYFLALAEKAEPKLVGAEQAMWLQRLDEEHDNMRSALEWSLVKPEFGEGMRLCGALQRFWFMRGYFSEGREWCARTLRNAGTKDRLPERAKALNAAGILAYRQGDYPGAKALYQQSLAIQRQLGDRRAIANLLNNLGNLASDQGDFSAARPLHEESLAIRRELGERRGVAGSLSNLGVMADRQGDLDSARALHAQSLAIWRELGDRWGIATSLANLGEVAFEQGDFPTARALYDENLAIRQELGDRRGIAISLEGLATVGGPLGSSMCAARMWGAAEQLREEIGSPVPQNERSRYDQRVAAARAALRDDAAFSRAWQEGRALTLEQAIELALEKLIEQL